MNFSGLDFLAVEFSTSSSIFATAEFLYSRSTSAVITPERFTPPDNSSSPAFISLGTGSPFKLFKSTALSPVSTRQSTGIFSPALIRILSPVLSSSGETTVRFSPFTSVAVSLLSSISFEMELREEPTATLCNSSPS